jgi:PAS domain S-box-containing protein
MAKSSLAKSNLAQRNQTAADAPRILEAVPVGIITVDENKHIGFMNSAAAQLCGVIPEMAEGQTCREVLKSSLCDGDCPLKKMMASGNDQSPRDAVLIRHDGRSVLPVRVAATGLANQYGDITGGVITVQSHQLARLLESEKGLRWEDFVGESPAVQQIFEVLKVVVPTPATVLVEGPTGTGKDLLAHIIHGQSPRAGKPFIKVNCAALPENLLESEMFGYLRGAFTGADRDKPGRFQLADGGTIFLDEISEMPLALQAKLLRVIEDREFYPLGARKTVKVDVRIIAACNRQLAEQVKEGLFREDLYYRLNVIRVHVPPLKERRQDIPLLIRRFIQKKNVEKGTFICRFDQTALDRLLNYDYPGNVREMENILEHACLLCQGDVIHDHHLPWSLRQQVPTSHDASLPDERQEIIRVLTQEGWNRTRAAEVLGIDRTTLWRRMKRLGIRPPR